MLDFSDRTFRHFFASELDIDIDDPQYAENGSSKGKRLRSLLQKVDDAIAVRILNALWTERQTLLENAHRSDPVHQAEGRLLTLFDRLNGQGAKGETPPPAPTVPADEKLWASLRSELLIVRDMPPQQRGFSFESFLKRAFDAAGLNAREPFRNRGEQIDGSFILGEEVYLLEAKWQAAPTPAADLHAFHGKLDQKATWARGLFISFNGYSEDGLAAFGTGRRIICMDGRDLYNALEGRLPLREVLARKVRRAAETGRIFVPVPELFGAGYRSAQHVEQDT